MDPTSQLDKILQRIYREGRRPGEQTFFASERSRAMVALLLALAAVTLALNLPFYDQEVGVGWRSRHRSESITLVPEPEEIVEKEEIEGGLITRFSELPEEEKSVSEEVLTDEERGVQEADSMPRIARVERIEKSPILDFAEEGPAIVGGIGSLYLNIDYPKAARDAGVQGLTVLMFVVEKDGSTSDITVLKSLHPACDSAAVAAVRRTRFKPGRQNGNIVRVKMRLPVRFRLIDPNLPSSEARQQS